MMAVRGRVKINMLTVDPDSDMATTLTVRNTRSVGRSRHVPGRFDVNGDGDVSLADVLEIYKLSKKTDGHPHDVRRKHRIRRDR